MVAPVSINILVLYPFTSVVIKTNGDLDGFLLLLLELPPPVGNSFIENLEMMNLHVPIDYLIYKNQLHVFLVLR